MADHLRRLIVWRTRCCAAYAKACRAHRGKAGETRQAAIAATSQVLRAELRQHHHRPSKAPVSAAAPTLFALEDFDGRTI